MPSFQITGIARPSVELLSAAKRVVVDQPQSAPCRVTLQDAAPGETVLLLNYEHHSGPSAYRSTGPIFVRESASTTTSVVDQIPEAIARRLMSVRAYGSNGDMIDAEVCEGASLPVQFIRMFANPDVAFLHLHHARRGCYAARVDRH
jgi:hypothetical protein